MVTKVVEVVAVCWSCEFPWGLDGRRGGCATGGKGEGGGEEEIEHRYVQHSVASIAS